MNRDQVRARMERFYRYLAQEQELRDELTSLKFTNVSEQTARESLSRQHQLLAQINRLHKEEMLPMVSELANFVALRLKDAAKAPAAAPAAPAAAKKPAKTGKTGKTPALKPKK